MKLTHSQFDTDNDSLVIGITGCSGFIGSHLVKRILSTTKWQLIAVDTERAKVSPYLNHPRFRFIQDDYTKTRVLTTLTENCHVIFCLASLCNPSQYNLIPLDVIESNFNHPTTLVNACMAKNIWLIHFSTSEVYGKTISAFSKPKNGKHPGSKLSDYILKEDESPLIMGPANKQRWSYAAAKQLLERYIVAAGETSQLPYTILRPFNFIGPNMDYIPGLDGEGIPRVLACFMSSLLKGQPMKLVDGGKSWRCFTYIDDVMDFCMALFKNPQGSKGEIFNVGAPQNEISIAGLAFLICELAQAQQWQPPEIVSVTAEEFYGEGYDDSDRRYPDISKAKKLLGWQAKTDLKTALSKTMGWYQQHYSKFSRIYYEQKKL